MRSFFRFLRPMVFARRKAIFAGVFGGNRTWLALGGAAWIFHWLGRLVGVTDPTPRYTRELGPGERVVVVHEPLSPAAEKKLAKKARREERRGRRRG